MHVVGLVEDNVLSLLSGPCSPASQVMLSGAGVRAKHGEIKREQ